MKFVQLLRPLFFVALGLHALALFLPYGEPETVVIEDVELFEASQERPNTLPSTPPSALPVPDLNATTGTKPKPAPSSASTSAVNTASNAAATQRTATPRRVARATNTRPATSNRSAPSSAPNSSASDSADSNSSQAMSQTRQPTDSNRSDSSGNTLAIFEPPIEDPGTNVAAANSDASNRSGNTARDSNLSIDTLLAKVTQQMPDSLRDFVAALDKSLTYSAENTDDASAQKAREAWQANIQRQANVGQIERMQPAEITDLTQIEYPIESSLKAEGRSLRRCLTEDPKSAEVGVLFDAQGNVVDEPVLLRSTGYGALNEEIKATVVAYKDFPSDRASKAYTFEVEVFYDSELCITAAELQR